MKDSEKISLRNLVYWGYVGASDWERETRTRIEVDIELYADLKKACKSDDLNDTIDYSMVHDLAANVIGERHHNLLESLAEEIADAAFGICDYGKIVVRVRKPQPPVGGPCDCAEVEIIRHKTDRQ